MTFATPQEARAFVDESERMVDDLYDYVFPPWRWLKWWRLYREVKRRNARVEAWLAERKRA